MILSRLESKSRSGIVIRSDSLLCDVAADEITMTPPESPKRQKKIAEEEIDGGETQRPPAPPNALSTASPSQKSPIVAEMAAIPETPAATQVEPPPCPGLPKQASKPSLVLHYDYEDDDESIDSNHDA